MHGKKKRKKNPKDGHWGDKYSSALHALGMLSLISIQDH